MTNSAGCVSSVCLSRSAACSSASSAGNNTSRRSRPRRDLSLSQHWSTVSRNTASVRYRPSPMLGYWAPCPVNMNCTERLAAFVNAADQPLRGASAQSRQRIGRIATHDHAAMRELASPELQRIGGVSQVDIGMLAQVPGQIRVGLRQGGIGLRGKAEQLPFT